MVAISSSGSGEGPGWATGPGYSTFESVNHCGGSLETKTGWHDQRNLVELCEFGIWARSINPSAFGFVDEVVAGGVSLPNAAVGSAHCAAVAC